MTTPPILRMLVFTNEHKPYIDCGANGPRGRFAPHTSGRFTPITGISLHVQMRNNRYGGAN